MNQFWKEFWMDAIFTILRSFSSESDIDNNQNQRQDDSNTWEEDDEKERIKRNYELWPEYYDSYYKVVGYPDNIDPKNQDTKSDSNKRESN